MHPDVARLIGALLVLLFSGLSVAAVLYLRDAARYKDALLRGISWFPVIAYFSGAVALGSRWFAAAVIALSARALYELYRADSRERPVWAWGLGFVATLVPHALWIAGLPRLALAWGPLWLVAVLGAASCYMRGKTFPVVMRRGLWALLCGWGLSTLLAPVYTPLGLGERGWQGAVMFLLTCAQFNDLVQYLWGKLLGGRRLAPKISPGKTWAGTIGGALTTTLLGAWLGVSLLGVSAPLGALLSLGICVLGVFGDLLTSAIKRELGVKDLGALLPGMGGVLDRVDSVLLSAPAFLVFLWWWV